MLSEPVRRVSFGLDNEANCQVGEGYSTQKLFWFLFQLGQKGTQTIFDCAQQKKYNLKEQFLD